MCAHLVNRRGYWSLETSYREDGKVKKRRLAYYGRQGPPSQQTYSGDYGVNWEQIEKDELRRMEEEEVAYQAILAGLPDGLHVGPTDPIAPAAPTDTVSTPESSPGDAQDAPAGQESDAPSEPSIQAPDVSSDAPDVSGEGS